MNSLRSTRELHAAREDDVRVDANALESVEVARRNNLKRFLFVALPVLSLLAANPAHAQTERIEVTPFVGYLFGGTFLHFEFSPPMWSPGFHIADHTTYGLRVGFNATQHLEPEIQWSYTDTHLQPRELDPLRINFFIAGLNYNFCAGPIRPYVSAGLGAGLF